ncbi:MAG TPA: site-specific integrase [Steroidobacteraceae bacterium]|nr:site-specific integrase [Steroidobacteraceae bacterium]
MRAIIGAKLLSSKVAQPAEKPFEIYDSRLPGFTLRVQPSGVRSFYARTGRNTRVALGKVGKLTPDEARERCQKVLGNLAHGRAPLVGLGGAVGVTLAQFIEDSYRPWLMANRPKGAKRTLQRIATCFGEWYSKPLADITVELIEHWRTRRLSTGTEPLTILRDVMTLSGVLTRAVRLGKLPENVVRRVERPRIDRCPKVRYLDPVEDKRLREALRERDKEMQDARESANCWRQARKQHQLPGLLHYGDHLTPAVLLSMNTGVRRGELLALRWSAIDTKGKQLTIEGSTAKNQQTRHIPLNAEALEVLKQWKEQVRDGERVFPIDTGFKTAWAALLERAKITKFRWHDLRHHFASRLVQAGVPLNTVRELLGHGSMAMTLRYAHLAPDQKREAVEKLMQP